jgi:hypothetical protein
MKNEVIMDIVANTDYPCDEYKPPKVPTLDGDDDEDLPGDVVVFIHNIRKVRGRQAKLLCEYKFGTRWWCLIKKAHEDVPILVERFLEKFGICQSKVGCKLPKDVDRQKKTDSSVEEETKTVACTMDHQSWLNYEEEGNPGYCKFPYHFHGVLCAMCNCEFTHEKVTNGKYVI